MISRATTRAAVACIILFASGGLTAQEVKDYSSTIAEFSKSTVVARYFDNAYGYAIFPTIGKGGIVIGAAHGKGQVYREGEVIGFSSLTEVSVGFQFGGQAYSQVVFFEDERALQDFTSGNFEFSAEASAIAVTASAGAEAGTEGAGAGAGVYGVDAAQANIDYYKGMVVFTLAKGGLMYQATIAGQKYDYDPRR